MKPLDLWTRFREELLTELRSRLSAPEVLAWCLGATADAAKRTSLFTLKDGVLDRAAQHLQGMELVLSRGSNRAEDYLRIDATIRDTDGYPQVFIEVENRLSDTQREVEKLTYVRSPLRVLITYGSRWPDEQRIEEWRSQVSRCQRNWLAESPEVVYGFAILAADSSNTHLELHTFAWNQPG